MSHLQHLLKPLHRPRGCLVDGRSKAEHARRIACMQCLQLRLADCLGAPARLRLQHGTAELGAPGEMSALALHDEAGGQLGRQLGRIQQTVSDGAPRATTASRATRASCRSLMLAASRRRRHPQPCAIPLTLY